MITCQKKKKKNSNKFQGSQNESNVTWLFSVTSELPQYQTQRAVDRNINKITLI